ncbi:MAG: hypothetical protein ACXVRE_01495 [Gaiellaceae bacterium]
MAKKFDPKAKAKRQKIYAAVGGVLLLGVLAFQVPRTLKLLHQSNANASSATTSSAPATGTTGAIAPPSLAGGNATSSAAAAVSSDGVSDPGVVPAPQSGQLLAFSRFKTKDPFAQQLSVGATGAAGSTGAGATGSSGTTGGGGSGSSGSGSTAGDSGNPPVPKATTATISVNGVSEDVRVGAQFPASNPTFVLVSLTKTTAKIGIAGGSLTGSAKTVTLKKNVPLTLMNTADGTRYVLRLISVS